MYCFKIVLTIFAIAGGSGGEGRGGAGAGGSFSDDDSDEGEEEDPFSDSQSGDQELARSRGAYVTEATAMHTTPLPHNASHRIELNLTSVHIVR